MSLLIQSEDVDTGTIYDGTWEMSASFSGLYEVSYMYWETITVPWIWTGVDQIQLGYSNVTNGSPVNYTYVLVDLNAASLSTLTTTGEVATAIKNAFATAISPDSNFSIVCVFHVDSLSYDVTFNFDNNGDPGYGKILLEWSNSLSTASGVFDKAVDEVSEDLANGDAVTFNLSSQHVLETDPKFLLLTIDESNSQIVSSCTNTKGTIIVATSDLPVTGQIVRFNTRQNQLNIGVYRTNISNSTVPVGTIWNLILKPT